ncbi:methyltransferase family protein [Aliiruegeria haliotis]|uniref:Methyltransferase family protein n=1 Tax=Aliiruegeria haliotis TaxID=1280846 RepID=A0A2T0RZC4_9RHOB|nr:class I SAM-dependent methyltransferase [Aliiruegeria haliotis]PRY26518.1 methyltransferase family protein [Aliiruegeria haliotis]
MTDRPGPEGILPTYHRVAREWARDRNRSLFEQIWLRRLLDAASGPSVLDLGCGSGEPIASWLVEQGAVVTGVDGAEGMCAEFRARLPGVSCIHADMRTLALGRRFNAIVAWNSFFHLSPDSQRAMFPIFAEHAAPGASLMFTSGPSASEAYGTVADEPVYHASLDPSEYRDLLRANGFEEIAFAPEDPECHRHTIWLARRVTSA